MMVLKHKIKHRDITCNQCGKTITLGLKTIGQGISKVKCWDIPTGWNVTLPSGWLCPKCSKV